MKPGLFITFEGGEGGGKTTQSTLLAEKLAARGIPHLRTREPGGTEGAEQIRNLLVQGECARWEKMTELLLHFAARLEHVEKVVKPALAVGKTVICDRFTDSTLAYQGYGHGLGADIISMVRHLTIGTFQPDLTFILDLSASTGIDRANARHGADNRYEQMGLDFHRRVREGFLLIAKENPRRCHVLDASQPIAALEAAIWERVGVSF
jgi:dTMP kinase